MCTLACVASVSVGLSARWRRFSLFGCAKIGASATLMEAAGRGMGSAWKGCLPRTFLRPPQFFPRPEKRKVHRTCGKPYRNACYAAGYVCFCKGYSGPSRVSSHVLREKNSYACHFKGKHGKLYIVRKVNKCRFRKKIIYRFSHA